MQNPSSENMIGRMVHALCIPFTIHRRGGDKVCLQEVANVIGNPWKEKPAPQTVEEKLPEYQAQAYFHPFVRRFLFNPASVKRYLRDDVKGLSVELDSQLTKQYTVELSVLRCELVLFQPDIGILLLETESRQTLEMQKSQLLIDALRRLYPPYFDSFEVGGQQVWQGGHCPVKVTLLDGAGSAMVTGFFREDVPDKFAPHLDAMLKLGHEPTYPLAAHWQKLLAPFDCIGNGSAPYLAVQLGDDRAPILSWLAVDDPGAIDPGNWVRTCFADAPGNDRMPYAGKFLQDFERDYCYERYWYADDESDYRPSRILNCGYAFSYVGSEKDTGYFANGGNGALFTFRHIYIEMGLIAHFQKASLLAASRRLSQLVSRDKTGITMPDQGKVRAFYDQFVEFTQSYWFDEISPQEQGRELFQMWRKHLRIQELYDEVRQELKDLVDYSEMRAAGDLNRRVFFFGSAGVLITFFSLLSSIFGMNKPEDFLWYHWISAGVSINLAIVLILVWLFNRNKH